VSAGPGARSATQGHRLAPPRAGLSDSITTTWPLATVPARIRHLVGNTFRYASRQDWDAIRRTCGRSTPRPTERFLRGLEAPIRFSLTTLSRRGQDRLGG